jgi:hypothetical protein
MAIEGEKEQQSSRAALAIGFMYAGGLAACVFGYFAIDGHPGFGLSRGESSIFMTLGAAVAFLGACVMRRSRPQATGNGNFLQSSFKEGVNPHDLYSKSQLAELQIETQKRHQKCLLWSLPFWFTTLWFLIIGKGELGGATLFGISNLWLMALTLGIFFLHRFYYWCCPACDAHLPKHSSRIICDKCGVILSGNTSVYSKSRHGCS